MAYPPAPRRPTERLLGSAQLAWGYRDGATVSVMVATILALAWFLGDFADHGTQVTVHWTVLMAQSTALIWFSHRVVRLVDRRDPAYRFWWTVRGAAVLFTVGNVAQLAGVLSDPYSSSAAIGGTTMAALLAAGTAWILSVMLRYPTRLGSVQERARFWLDLATVVTGVAVFSWYFAATNVHFDSGWRLLSSLPAVVAGPVALLVAGFAVAKLMITGKAPYSRLTGIFGGLTAVVSGTARGLGPNLLQSGHATIYFGLMVLGSSLTLLGVLVHERYLRGHTAPPQAARDRPYSLVPYLAIAATYGLLIVVLARRQFDVRMLGVLTGALASTVLVVIRQLAAFAENARLLRQLQTALGERDALADALREQAFHDTLTGLANRALLTERLADEYTAARRCDRPVMLMLVDLDDFKPVNDKLGHHAGDLLLQAVAGRLRQSVRDTDTVARLGGDEFAVLLCERSAEPIPAIAERMLANLTGPYHILGEEIQLGASLGIAVDHDGSWGADQLLLSADAAMYTAKRQGKGTFAACETVPTDRGYEPGRRLAPR